MPKYGSKLSEISNLDINREKKLNPFLRHGSVINSEFYGSNNDPNSLYIGHNTMTPDLVALMVSQAIIRKVMKKGAGFDYMSTEEETPLFDFANSATISQAKFYLSWTVLAAGGTITQTAYNIPDDATIQTIASATIQTGIYGQMAKENEGCLMAISLYEGSFNLLTNAPSDDSRLRCKIDLTREILHVYCKSVLTVQNRTLNDLGSSSIDVNNNQPLEGYLYKFSGGTPQIKAFKCKALDSINRYGVLFKRSLDMDPDNSFKEIPYPRQFANCVKYATVQFSPGDLKRSKLDDYWSGYFNTVIGTKLQCTVNISGTGVAARQSYSSGQCELMAVQELLNSGSSNNIILTYECKKTVGAYLVTTADPLILPQYAATEFNGGAAS